MLMLLGNTIVTIYFIYLFINILFIGAPTTVAKKGKGTKKKGC